MVEIRDKIFNIIISEWPVHATEIADKLDYSLYFVSFRTGSLKRNKVVKI